MGSAGTNRTDPLENQRLRRDAALIEPLEARFEGSASASNGREAHLFSGFVGVYLLHHGVEVEDMNALRALPFEDGAHLSLKETKLTSAHGAGTVDSDRDLSDTFANYAW